MLGFSISYIDMSVEQFKDSLSKLPLLVKSLMHVGISEPMILLFESKGLWLKGSLLGTFRNGKIEYFDMEVTDYITLKHRDFTLSIPLLKGENA